MYNIISTQGCAKEAYFDLKGELVTKWLGGLAPLWEMV